MIPFAVPLSTPLPLTTTLVATPLPETTALRLPPDSIVPPTVSNVQIGDNARGNAGTTHSTSEEILIEADESIPPSSISSRSTGPQSANASAQTGFFAQLMGQELSPVQQQALQGLLAQYERMVAFSGVKYKPSNATLPPPAPTGVFERVLAEQKSTPRIEDSQLDFAFNTDEGPPVDAATQIAAENHTASISFLDENEVFSLAGAPPARSVATAYDTSRTRIETQQRPPIPSITPTAEPAPPEN